MKGLFLTLVNNTAKILTNNPPINSWSQSKNKIYVLVNITSSDSIFVICNIATIILKKFSNLQDVLPAADAPNFTPADTKESGETTVDLSQNTIHISDDEAEKNKNVLENVARPVSVTKRNSLRSRFL